MASTLSFLTKAITVAMAAYALSAQIGQMILQLLGAKQTDMQLYNQFIMNANIMTAINTLSQLQQQMFSALAKGIAPWLPLIVGVIVIWLIIQLILKVL